MLAALLGVRCACHSTDQPRVVRLACRGNATHGPGDLASAAQEGSSAYPSAAGDHAQRNMYAYVPGAVSWRNAAAAGTGATGSEAGAVYSIYTVEAGLSAYSGAAQGLAEELPPGTVVLQMVGSMRRRGGRLPAIVAFAHGSPWHAANAPEGLPSNVAAVSCG